MQGPVNILGVAGPQRNTFYTFLPIVVVFVILLLMTVAMQGGRWPCLVLLNVREVGSAPDSPIFAVLCAIFLNALHGMKALLGLAGSQRGGPCSCYPAGSSGCAAPDGSWGAPHCAGSSALPPHSSR